MSDTLDPGIRLETARNLRSDSLEALQVAIEDWWASAGTGESHAVDRRWVRRCMKNFLEWDALYKARWKETVGNRRAA